MPNERADLLAMGARGLFEPLGERGPILLVAVEPAFVTHVRPMPQGNSLTVGRFENLEKSGVR